jgi:molybdopterin-containing oxidoreductase family iron-sulfur binding subunit
MDRREFIRVAGVAAAGLAAGASGKLLPEKTHASSESHAPAAGRRWAMVIDLNRCKKAEGCTDCVKACNVAHNVPHFDSAKDEVKWIWKEPFEHAFHSQEHEYAKEELKHIELPLLCNHCDNPPCVRVCPTQATWKRESDGIVMMDWHRCIGCRYCVAACPYGSRSFNWRDPRPHIENVTDEYPTRMRGVVEKCTFCEERLAKGEMPACVDACKEKAMIFGDLEDPDSEVREVLAAKFAIRRKPELGTKPEVYYLV